VTPVTVRVRVTVLTVTGSPSVKCGAIAGRGPAPLFFGKQFHYPLHEEKTRFGPEAAAHVPPQDPWVTAGPAAASRQGQYLGGGRGSSRIEEASGPSGIDPELQVATSSALLTVTAGSSQGHEEPSGACRMHADAHCQ
jgi:hypothetical protein